MSKLAIAAIITAVFAVPVFSQSGLWSIGQSSGSSYSERYGAEARIRALQEANRAQSEAVYNSSATAQEEPRRQVVTTPVRPVTWF